MNYDLLLLVIFYIFLLIIFKLYRNKFEIQYKVFVMYKAQWGIKLMNKIAKKFPKSLRILGEMSIVIGFLGMIVTVLFIVYATFEYFFAPIKEAALAPLLPGIAVSDNLPILSFWHWIIAILIVATIHEFSHGVYARYRNIKVKSSGFAFLGPLLAAFVEPDEKQLAKKSIKDQLLVYSAGPFSNILTGIVFLLILVLVSAPMTSGMTNINGLLIGEINSSLAISESGLKGGMLLQEIDGNKIDDIYALSEVLNNKNGGDVIPVKADDKFYNVTLSKNPLDETKGYLGIGFSNYDLEVKENYPWWSYVVMKWINMLFFWLFNISVGVGLFNLLPLGPVDGGRMFYTAMLKFMSKKKALNILSIVSLIIFAMILINMLPFFTRLLNFLVSIF